MATLLDGYTMNWKNLTVDLSKQWKLSDSQLKTLADYGYTYTYINEPQSNSGGNQTSSTTIQNNTYTPAPNYGSTSGGGSGGSSQTIAPPKTWENYWSKLNNPSEISKYLNGQSGFATRVLWDRIVGTKNGTRKVWKFDGQNWVAEDQKGWDYYAKLNDANEVAFYLNSQDGFNVKTAGSKISGTKNWVQTTWSFDGQNWVPSATAQDVATKSGWSNTSSAMSTSSTSMQAGTNTSPAGKNLPPTEDSPKDTPTQDWGTYASIPDAAQVTTYLNTQPGFNTYVARDPVSNEPIPNKIEGTKNGVKTSWTFDGSNWVSDKWDTKASDMQVGEVTTENITTAQLNKLIADKGLDPATFTGKQKSAYDRLVIKAQENDKKATEDASKTDGTWDELSDTEKSINKMLDDKKDVNQLLVDTAREWVKILKEKIENITKPMQEQYDKLSTEWWAQEEKFKAQYEKQWADVERYENESRSAIKELEDLGRKQYKDYVSRVARVVSWRKAGISGELSAQWFNANVISNITSQVDTQYADERLKVQTFLSDVLDKSLSRQRDLYTDLFNRRSSLTAAEQGFRNTVGERYKYLSTLKQNIAEVVNTMFEPIENINKTLTGAYTPVEASSATSESYEQEWKQGDQNKRIAQLSSQLHNFLGSEKNADGTAKYDTNKIPTEKLAEFSQLGTASEAYRAAVDYLTGGKWASGASSSFDSTVSKWKDALSNIDTGGGKKTSTPAPKVPIAATTPTTDASAVVTPPEIQNQKNDLYLKIRLLQENWGFAKTDITYEEAKKALDSSTNKAQLDLIASKITAAYSATPAAGAKQESIARFKDAGSPYTSLSAEQKKVVEGTQYYKDILKIIANLNSQPSISATDAERAKKNIQYILQYALAWKPYIASVQNTY